MYDRITYEYHGPKCSDLLLLVHIAIAEPETGIGTPFLRSAVVVRGFVVFPEDGGRNFLELRRRPAEPLGKLIGLCFASMGSQFQLIPLKPMDLEEDRSTKQPPLGFAKRIGAKSPTSNILAHSLPKASITHALSSVRNSYQSSENTESRSQKR